MTNTPSQPGSLPIATATGTEIVSVNSGPVWSSLTTQQIAGLAGSTSTTAKVTALNTVGAGTITAAGIVGKDVIRGGAQSGTAFTDTTDTAAAIIAALPSGAPVGTSFTFDYANTTNAVATIAHGTGVTIKSGITPTATVTIPANAYATFLVVVASASTITMTQTGSGAFAADSADTTKVIGYNLTGQTTATTALIATTNTANATYTLPPATGNLAATTGSDLYLADVYKNTLLTITNSVTPTLIPGLAATVTAGTYKVKAFLTTTPAATGGVAVSFVLTTAVLSSCAFNGVATAAAAVATQATTTTTSATNIIAVASIPLTCVIEGTMVVSTGGTFSLYGCQNTQVNSAATINAGGYMELVRIA